MLTQKNEKKRLYPVLSIVLFSGIVGWLVTDTALEVRNQQQIDRAIPSKQMHAFHAYLDSLQKNLGDTNLLDNLKLVRPGLADSIRLLDFLYSNNQ